MRLPVILVQFPPASGASLAEDLVGNLIGRAGLDLTLVNRFDAIATDSTDRLTLDAITVPVAVLDWRSPDEIRQVLGEIGFDGVRCAHQLDPQVLPSPGSTSVRRLFLFDLNQHTDVNAIVAELNRLRESLSVKTVSLGGLSTLPPRKATAHVVAEKRNDDQVTRGPDTDASTIAKPTVPLPSDSTSDEHLDAMLDELDQLDV